MYVLFDYETNCYYGISTFKTLTPAEVILTVEMQINFFLIISLVEFLKGLMIVKRFKVHWA